MRLGLMLSSLREERKFDSICVFEFFIQVYGGAGLMVWLLDPSTNYITCMIYANLMNNFI